MVSSTAQTSFTGELVAPILSHLTLIVHRNLFNFIWSAVIQDELNKFIEFWNLHRVRRQKQKLNPSGGTPIDFWTRPEDFGGQRTGFQVPLEAVQAMRGGLTLTREQAFQWVTPLFAQAAWAAWEAVGSPALDPKSAWDVFAQMEHVLRMM